MPRVGAVQIRCIHCDEDRHGEGSAQHVRLPDDAAESEGARGQGEDSPASPGREEVHEPEQAAIPRGPASAARQEAQRACRLGEPAAGVPITAATAAASSSESL